MGLLTIVLATGRIGNAMVALRCVAVEDKSLSMAFNVVFMSLFAMLPAPMASARSVIKGTVHIVKKQLRILTKV